MTMAHFVLPGALATYEGGKHMSHQAISNSAVDLRRLTNDLEGRFHRNPPLGYLQGRTEIRDAVAQLLGCSLLEAEVTVDQLESNGLIEYEGDASGSPASPERWSFDKNRASGMHPIP
jgi:hypothetical protein